MSPLECRVFFFSRLFSRTLFALEINNSSVTFQCAFQCDLWNRRCPATDDEADFLRRVARGNARFAGHAATLRIDRFAIGFDLRRGHFITNGFSLRRIVRFSLTQAL